MFVDYAAPKSDDSCDGPFHGQDSVRNGFEIIVTRPSGTSILILSTLLTLILISHAINDLHSNFSLQKPHLIKVLRLYIPRNIAFLVTTITADRY